MLLMFAQDTLAKVIVILSSFTSWLFNGHGGGACVSQGSQRLCCLGGFCLLIGSPMANRSWVREQTKSASKDPYEYKIKETVHPAQDRVTGA